MEFTRDEAFDRALLRDIKDRVFYFLKKAYGIVNDPSTDSMISWGPNGNSLIVHRPLPLEYTESFLFHSGALSMERFVAYGFTMTVSGSQVEYANDDFVRGQPQRLEKICDPFVARVKQHRELRLKQDNDRKRHWEEIRSYGMVVEIFKHIYSVVDDPATNSFISWGPNGKSFIVLDPQRCACYCFPYNLLEECGFTKTVSGSQMEFASENFVAGKPELLKKISEKHKPAMIAYTKKFREWMEAFSRNPAMEKRTDYVLQASSP
ncbi:heat stress transcription factor C-1 isoform X2 [Brassica rapa]|uniref:HSF-type DNA-binding domain-containing protein n=2 Tax=Brassica campestris TaxID=3711 RepID=M4E624_BRACM|nr:heat stress transcription factor C-1 isoform X2 [Brassica rapa]